MEEALNLSLQQKLQQKLSPLQVRFVRMLEMNGPEVEDEVKHALDDNPALDVAEESEHEESDFNESAEDMQLADYGSEDEIPSYRLEARNHSASDTYYEPVAVDSSSTLLETLMSQLAEHDLDDTQLTVAQYVIGNLDDNGYLRRDVGSMSYDIEAQTGRHVTTRQVRLRHAGFPALCRARHTTCRNAS